MKIVLLATLATLTTGSVMAQDAEPAPENEAVALAEAPLRMNFYGGAWLVRAKGTGNNGGETLEIGDSGSTMGLGNLEALFRGELTIGQDEWSVRAMGSHGSWSGNGEVTTATTWGGVALNPGTDYASSLEMTWMAFEAHWDALTLKGDGHRHTTDPIDLVFGPHIGVAWLDLSQSLAGVSNSGNWWSLYGGAELSMIVDLKPFTSLLHSLTVGVGGSVGGTIADGGMFWKVSGGLGLNITPNFSVNLGYRLMEYKNLTNNTWDLSPSFPGLFAGLNISF
jgi:opacity protein-like surface antigen